MTAVPPLTPIDSSMFSGHHYDPQSRQMTVQFRNGAVHVYDDVPIEKHAAFAENSSPGRYFNENIKNNFASRKVAE